MKKTGLIFAVIIGFVFLAGCAKATPDPNYNYRVTGHFADWTSGFDSVFMMENVASNDERIKPLRSALRDAEYIYLYEYTPTGSAGWTVDYPGLNISVDGVYTVKFIRLARADDLPDGWEYDMWMPSTESGGFANLSPDTLYVPPGRSDEAAAEANDGRGSVNSNPVILTGPNTYYIVLAVMKDRSRAMGAVAK